MSLLRRKSYWQKGLASWIGKKSERLSITGKKIILLCMLLAIGSYCLYLVLSVFNNKRQTNYDVTQVSIPQHISQADKKKHPPISKKEFERVHKAYLYLDSLAKAPSGRALYDSIIHSRPGLLDSIRIIENIYQSQLKK